MIDFEDCFDLFEEFHSIKMFDVEEYLFDKQISFVRDASKFATAVCSVRAGKSVSCAADLIDTAIRLPGTLNLYITLARSSGKKILWPLLKQINQDYELSFIANEAELSMAHPNGSIIYLFGAGDAGEMEKIRGLSNVALVYIDEAQAFRSHIEELVNDIVVKRLYDTNGRCRLIGTPGVVKAGFFHECSVSNEWSHHHWTMFDNPWILKKSGKTPQELTDEDCQRRGVTKDHPSIQRENYGMWVYDPDSLLLNYTKELNDYDELPFDRYNYILGIDLGIDDADSLSVLAYSESSPVTWLVEEILTPNQLTDDLAAQINKLVAKYGNMQMVADTGGLGKKVVMDMMSRYGFVIDAADKLGKMTDYKFLNNALRTGMFKAKWNTRFAEDCNILERNDDKSTPDKIVVKGHSDAVDSALYAFALSPAYNYTPIASKALPGTAEYNREQEDLHKQAIIEKLQREHAMKNMGPMMNFPKVDGRDPWHNW